MIRFTVFMANQAIEVEAHHEETRLFCREYITDKTPTVSITITDEDICSEKKVNHSQVLYGGNDDSFYEIMALHRKISESLLDFGMLLFHGAAIACDDKAFIFTANSGTGKSTHILKWLLRAPNVTEINGDKPFIVTGDEPLVCGSPWNGKERIGMNRQAPLKSIILLERSEENSIKQVKLSDVFPKLCQQIIRPDDKTKARKALHLLNSLSSSVSFYHFHCNNFKDDCFDVAYNALVGQDQ